jgi:hypothetical protein
MKGQVRVAQTYGDSHHPGSKGVNVGDQDHERQQSQSSNELQAAQAQLYSSQPYDSRLCRIAHRAKEGGSTGGHLVETFVDQLAHMPTHINMDR